MKRTMLFLCPLALLLFATVGCDEVSGLPGDVQAMLSSASGVKIDMLARGGSDDSGSGNGDQLRDRLHLMDGSCDGSGSQNEFGGLGGYGIGNGDQDRLRLQDGSCGDGG